MNNRKTTVERVATFARLIRNLSRGMLHCWLSQKQAFKSNGFQHQFPKPALFCLSCLKGMQAREATTLIQRFLAAGIGGSFALFGPPPDRAHEDAFKEPNKLHTQNTVPF